LQTREGRGFLLKPQHPRGSPSRRRSEASQSKSSGIRNSKFQWQVHPQQKTECPGSCTAALNMAVSSGYKWKQSAYRQYDECSTAVMTEFNGVVLEEGKIVAITKTVLYLMKQNGH
jgi:hypothetical protein